MNTKNRLMVDIPESDVIITEGGKAQRSININNLLAIDMADISNDFAHQAAIYGWIANLVAAAEARHASSKHKRETEYADAYVHYREELSLSGKPTEAMVNNAIMLDDTYQLAKQEELAAEQEYKTLKALSDALKMRADMLISLGAHVRAERDMTALHINDND